MRIGKAKTRRETAYSNVRLDDLSTYKKIAFYKLVSRKELEGIAEDEGGQGLQGRQVRQRREKRMGGPRVRRADQDEDHEGAEKGRDPVPCVRAK